MAKGHCEPFDEPIEEPKENFLADKIIQQFNKNPRATYDNLAIIIGVSRSTIKRAISNLLSKGRVVRVGGKRYGQWKVKD